MIEDSTRYTEVWVPLLRRRYGTYQLIKNDSVLDLQEFSIIGKSKQYRVRYAIAKDLDVLAL